MHDKFCPNIPCNCNPDDYGHEWLCEQYCLCDILFSVRNDERKNITGHTINCATNSSKTWYWKVECDCG